MQRPVERLRDSKVITVGVAHNGETVVDCACGICMSTPICGQLKISILVQTLKVAEG